MKVLKLTGVSKILTKEAEERLDSEEDYSMFEDLTCENGRTREDYEALGMKVPKDLIEKEKNFDFEEDLNEEDFEEVTSKCRIFAENIIGYVGDENNTVIFTRDSLKFTVKETVEEIDKQLEL